MQACSQDPSCTRQPGHPSGASAPPEALRQRLPPSPGYMPARCASATSSHPVPSDRRDHPASRDRHNAHSNHDHRPTVRRHLAMHSRCTGHPPPIHLKNARRSRLRLSRPHCREPASSHHGDNVPSPVSAQPTHTVPPLVISSPFLGVFAVTAAGPGPRRGHVIYSGVLAAAAVTAVGVSWSWSTPWLARRVRLRASQARWSAPVGAWLLLGRDRLPRSRRADERSG